MRLGLIGFGAIGRLVAEEVATGKAGDVTIVGILVRDLSNYSKADGSGHPFVAHLDDLMALRPQVIAELAGHEALMQNGEDILRSGRTLIAISTGALSDDKLRTDLLAAADAGNSQMILPSGAIAGLDAIESAAVVGIDRVTHVVRKPPHALLPDDEAASVIRVGEPVELYRGPARDVTRQFPQNVNVVGLVSMAGIGLDRTEAIVIADPTVQHNTHEVTAEGPFGSIEVVVRNVPSPSNPKTGLIVAGSIIRALRRIQTRLLVGS